MPSNYQLSLQDTITSWKEFDLGKLQQNFHEELSNITKTANSCVETRKEMVRKTKRVNELKSLLPEDKFTMLTSTIKAYQSYIDDLTRRSTYSENIVKTISKKLDDVQNPLTILDETNVMYKSYCELTEKFEYYENENRKLNEIKENYEKLTKEKQEMNRKYTDLQNEYETLKNNHNEQSSQLQQYITASAAVNKKNSYIQKLEQQTSNQLKEIENLKAELSAVQTKYQDLKKNDLNISLQNQIDLLNTQVLTLQGQIEKGIEEKKLLQQSFEESKHKLLQEIDGHKNTISILNQEIENINDFELPFESSIKTESSSQSETYREDTSTTYNETNSLYQDKLQLMDQLDQLKQELTLQKDQYETKIHELESARQSDTATYTAKLSEYQKLLSETINKEIYAKLLRCFNVLQKGGININYTDDSSFVSTVNYFIENTEKLLLNKIDLLQKHNVELRKKYDELLSLHKKTQTSLAIVSDHERDLSLLTAKLENQITEQQQQLQQLQTKENNSNTNDSTPTPNTHKNTKSFDTIIKEQRDRYKNRVDELELENTKYKQQIQHLLSQIDDTNSSLKQRGMKYSLSHYQDPEMNYSPVSYYSNLYHGRNPLERGFIAIAEETISSPKTRTLVLCYLILIHILLIYFIIHMSQTHLD